MANQPQALIRRATDIAAQHAAGVDGLDRAIASLREVIAANERAMRRPAVPAAAIVDRHPLNTRRPLPAWAGTLLNWAAAAALGLVVGYMAGAGF